MHTRAIIRLSTARSVEQTRRELLAALSDRREIPRRVTAYAQAVRRHRECIFADALRGTRPASNRV